MSFFPSFDISKKHDYKLTVVAPVVAVYATEYMLGVPRGLRGWIGFVTGAASSYTHNEEIGTAMLHGAVAGLVSQILP